MGERPDLGRAAEAPGAAGIGAWVGRTCLGRPASAPRVGGRVAWGVPCCAGGQKSRGREEEHKEDNADMWGPLLTWEEVRLLSLHVADGVKIPPTLRPVVSYTNRKQSCTIH